MVTATRVFQTGGETGNVTDFLHTSGSPLNSSQEANTGNRSINMGVGSTGLGLDVTGVSKLRVGFFHTHESVQRLGSTGEMLFIVRFNNIAGDIYGIGLEPSSGNLAYYADGALLGAQSGYQLGFYDADVYKHMGLFAEQGGTISFYIDGRRVIEQTLPSGMTDFFIGTRISPTGWETHWIDDIYIDTLTDEVDHCPPTLRFYPSIPSADGADTAWTPSAGNRWQAVDEVPANTTDYIAATAPDLKNTVETADLTFDETLYALRAAIVNLQALRDNNTPEIRALVRDSGGSYANGGDQTVTATYDNYKERFLTQPDTTDWNKADFNAMQFGVESRGSYP